MNSGNSQTSIHELLQALIPQVKSPEQQAYIQFHARRYEFLLDVVQQFLAEGSEVNAIQMLDIGPAYQTYLMRQRFPVRINTMGFEHGINHKRPGEQHFRVDLNFSGRYIGPVIQHDLIIFSEVLEHLYTQPEIVLGFVLQFLKPGGYLILQTPNAVATFKRIMMLFGYNPYDLISEKRDGHFREYTSNELRLLFDSCGLEIVKIEMQNYFSYSQNLQRIYRFLNQFSPRSCRDGITVVARRSI